MNCMLILGNCPYFEYPSISYTGTISTYQCRTKYNPTLHYEMEYIEEMLDISSLYINDEASICSCSSISCIIRKSNNFSAKQSFTIHNVLPCISYKVQIRYYVTKRVFNGCCFDTTSFEEVFTVCMSFDNTTDTFSIKVNNDGTIVEGDFDPSYFINKYGPSLEISRGWPSIIGICES